MTDLSDSFRKKQTEDLWSFAEGRSQYPYVSEGKAVFFAGDYQLNWDRAEAFAKIHNMQRIQDTVAGKYLNTTLFANLIEKFSENQRKFWHRASRTYAHEVEGDVKTFISGAGSQSIFRKTELPTILRNPDVNTINGLDRQELRDLQTSHYNRLREQGIGREKAFAKTLDMMYRKIAVAELKQDLSLAKEKQNSFEVADVQIRLESLIQRHRVEQNEIRLKEVKAKLEAVKTAQGKDNIQDKPELKKQEETLKEKITHEEKRKEELAQKDALMKTRAETYSEVYTERKTKELEEKKAPEKKSEQPTLQAFLGQKDWVPPRAETAAISEKNVQTKPENEIKGKDTPQVTLPQEKTDTKTPEIKIETKEARSATLDHGKAVKNETTQQPKREQVTPEKTDTLKATSVLQAEKPKDVLQEKIPEKQKSATLEKQKEPEKLASVQKEVAPRKEFEQKARQEETRKRRNVHVHAFVKPKEVRSALKHTDSTQAKADLQKVMTDKSVTHVNGLNKDRLAIKQESYKAKAEQQGAKKEDAKKIAEDRIYHLVARHEQVRDRVKAFKGASELHTQPHSSRAASLQDTIIADRKEAAQKLGKPYKGPEQKTGKMREATIEYRSVKLRDYGRLAESVRKGHTQPREYAERKKSMEETLKKVAARLFGTPKSSAQGKSEDSFNQKQNAKSNSHAKMKSHIKTR